MKPKSLKHCKTCPLKGNPTVWSAGNPSSPIYFIGRNPGNTEVETGRPFVGRVGVRLNKVFKELGLSRRDVYITNLVKCWTPNDNVPPAKAVEGCWPYLKDELAGPDVLIVGLGK
ncbi:MAG: uracil-DNA glycosylase, partial [Bacteroidetes bacterium]|nr:uracil-DNA glycosylase [Bacteroidota bacterium]